ncbi:unnamed protein product [Prorocentrum cordatum]|uniref:Uncharacterized protein n=1 Tax=Prorocentrum cordatum TaxID=2364126 RepID=A0ABN9YKQ5_9DINO|nr:unnamed protein product [Polarella glacialis]
MSSLSSGRDASHSDTSRELKEDRLTFTDSESKISRRWDNRKALPSTSSATHQARPKIPKCLSTAMTCWKSGFLSLMQAIISANLFISERGPSDIFRGRTGILGRLNDAG